MNKHLLYGITVLLCTLMGVSQAKADDYADYLTAANGFTEVTTVAGLQSGSNYYYVFQSVEDPTLVLRTGRYQAKPDWASDGSWSMFYANAASSPVTDLRSYYVLDYSATYGIGVHSAVNTSHCFQTHSGAAYMWVNTYNETAASEWSGLLPTYADGSWTFQEYQFRANNDSWLGPWEAETGAVDGMAIAGNRTNTAGDEAGHFKLWRISKADFETLKTKYFTLALYPATSANPVNATYRMTNASLETGDTEGWTHNGAADADCGARDLMISNGDGRYVLNMFQWWSSMNASQTVSLPAGIYDVSAVVACWEIDQVTFSAGSQSVTNTGLGDATGIPVSFSNIEVGTTNSLTISCESAADWWSDGRSPDNNWQYACGFFKLDNVQFICKGVYLAGVALPLPNDDTTILTPGQWYYYDAAELGNYQLSGDLANMVYTQNSNQIVGEGISSRPALQKLTLDAGRVCFMTTNTGATLKITSMSGEGATYDFTAVTLNVDGLPNSIAGVSINPDGPGESGTRLIGQYLANKSYDLLAVQEDFGYNSTLASYLTDYGQGTWRGNVGVGALLSPADTDGLNFFWNTARGRNASGESWTRFAHSESGDGNNYIQKGWRYYEVTLADGIKVDVYMTHMDAGDVVSSRNIQWTELANAVIANENTSRPKIIMGDFNSRFTREAIIANFFTPVEATGNYTVSDAWVEKTRSGSYPSIGADAAGEVVDKIIYLNPTANGALRLTLNSYTRETDYTYGTAQGTSDTTPLGDHAPVVAHFTATAPAVSVAPALDRWVWKGETITSGSQKWYLFNVSYGTSASKNGFLSRNSTKLVNDPNESGVYPFQFSSTSSTTVTSSDNWRWRLTSSLFSYTATFSSTTSTATSFTVSQATAAIAGSTDLAYHFAASSRYFNSSSTTAFSAASSKAAANAWALISTDQAAMYNRFVLASDKAAKYVAYLPIDDAVKAQMITLLEKTGVTWTDGTTEQLEALNAQVEEWFDDEITITSATTQTVSDLSEGFYKLKAKVSSTNKQTVTMKIGNWTQTIPMTGTAQVDVELPLYYHNGEGAAQLQVSASGTSTFSNLQLVRYDSYYDETIGAVEYATTAIRYNTEIPAGVEVYYVDQINEGSVRNSIHLAKYAGSQLAAGEGVVLYKSGLTANTPFRFYRTNDEVSKISGNRLGGAVNRIEPANKESGTYYVLSRKTLDGETEPTIGFFRLSDATAVPAHKAYLLVGAGSSVKGYAFTFDKEEVTPTAIEQTETAAEATVVGIYSLGGARQQSLQRGVNIVRMSDGSVKKVLVK